MSKSAWVSLNKGDIVDVIAPAGRPQKNVLKRVPPFLKQWGLKARIHPQTMGEDLVCSNSKSQRFRFLKQALQARDSKMIWCLRGGYGSLHLLDDLSRLKALPPKIFLGFSDITSLHTFLNQEWGWPTLHGPHLDRFALGLGTKTEAKRIKDLVFAHKSEVGFKLKAMNKAAKAHKALRASITGGNLITLQSSFGTPYEIQTRNKILFLEEIGERAYKIDRVLEHLRQVQLLKNVKAVVLGQFTESLEPDGRNIVPKLLKQWAETQNFPVLSGIPSGHGHNQHPLPLGTKAQLDLGSQAKLVVPVGSLSC
jgi:muramoyltetrapeptide carboxypeptidase